MAKRPVFIPEADHPFFREIIIDFQWFSGFSKSQAQKSIASLHQAAKNEGIYPVLEISSKSPNQLGVSLSAFNLMLEVNKGYRISVECAFQGSKVFESGGPYTNLYGLPSREAKRDDRLKNSGELIGFIFMDEKFPIRPQTAFYDWLYLNALRQNEQLSNQLLAYRGFTDIAFNPEKSINCQARSAALFVALSENGLLEQVNWDSGQFLSIVEDKDLPGQVNNLGGSQLELPFSN